MSVRVDGSTSAPVFVDGNVVQNVVGLGQEIGLEGHLLSLRTGVDEGRDVAALGGYKMNLARALGHEVGSSPMSAG